MVNIIKSLSQAYEEISVMKIQKVRNTIFLTRDMYGELSKLYQIVKTSYKHKILQLMKQKKIKDASSLLITAKNGKSISVFLSANSKLYGKIINDTFVLFSDHVSKNQGDIMIIGKVGKELIETLDATQRKYTYFDLPDSDITFDDLKSIVIHLLNYETINVFYGQFQNLVFQTPQVSNITGDQPFTEAQVEEIQKQMFLFEPSLEKILEFFETQIFSALFKQTAEENQLARHASRIEAMEQALSNVDKRLDFLDRSRRRAQRFVESKKQLELTSRILAGV